MIAPDSGTLEASNQAPQIAADLRSSAYGSAAASTATGILGMAADFWPGAKALLPDGRGILPMASRSPRIYDPPAQTPRPFAADYPGGAPVDATGRLTHDIEGRPLVARHVVGREVAGEADHFLSPGELDALAAETTTRGVVTVPHRQLAPSTGQVVGTRDRRSGHLVDTEIRLSDGLTPDQRTRVLGHEVGHVIEELAGRLSTKGLNRELAQVYNTLNTGTMRTRNLTGPQHLGYRDDEIPREFIAESIRAYMADPNYLKTVAPRTAAAIRAAVNDHPKLRDIIQFNAIAGGAAVPLAGAAMDGEDR
jgi:hypothetical protein